MFQEKTLASKMGTALEPESGGKASPPHVIHIPQARVVLPMVGKHRKCMFQKTLKSQTHQTYWVLFRLELGEAITAVVRRIDFH